MSMFLHEWQEEPAPYPVRPDADPWEELANAVIYQAAADWLGAVRTLQHPPGRPGAVQDRQLLKAALMRYDCEKFFRSRWFRILTGTDPAVILERLNNEEEETL